MTDPVCVISGVGPGTGSALARRFARGGYRVAMLARNAERLNGLERELADSKAYLCDVSDATQVEATLDKIERQLGVPTALVHNAVGGAFGSFLEIDPAVLNRNFQINTMGLLYLARRVAPAMISAGHGNIIVTGNTSALRGRPSFAGFAPTKAAQRILTEAMARELGPKGVHVAYIVIDAVIDVPWTRERFKDKPDEFFIKPAAIADEAWHRRDRIAVPGRSTLNCVLTAKVGESGMAALRIFSYLPNPRIWKATITARLCGVEIEVRGASPRELSQWLWDFDARPIAQVPRETLAGAERTGRIGFADQKLYKTDAFLKAHPFGTVPAALSGRLHWHFRV